MMTEAEFDRASVLPVPSGARARPTWIRCVSFLALISLAGFIVLGGHTLWAEWKILRQEQSNERQSAVIGYVNINPNMNFAARPDDWFHDEGTDSLLWAGWKDGENRWFRFGRGELEAAQLSDPIGRDAIQAIDYPVYEREGGIRWGKIPTEATVAGFEEGGESIAYPLKVLNKVIVINDQIGDRPILVTLTPSVDVVSIYEATLDGRRVTLGHGGYFRGYRSILYDRGTQSLWSESEGAMVAVAGRRKGASLKMIAQLNLIAWGDWRDDHPRGQLLVGADRSKGMPID